MARFWKNLDLLGLCLIAVGTSLIALFWPDWSSPLRVVLGLAITLVAPGYALTAALLPGRYDIDGVERLALSVGLSVACIPLLGLLFTTTPWGIRLLPMALGLATFTLLASFVALYRRRQLVPSLRFFDHAAVRRKGWGLLLLIGISFGATVVAAQALRPPVSVTEFYLLNAEGRLEAYPTTLSPGQTFQVTLGIGNHEGRAESFRIHAPFVGEVPIAEVSSLGDGGRWERKLTLEAPEGTGRTQLTFALYRSGDTEPYRLVQLFVMLNAAQVPESNGAFIAALTTSQETTC